MTSFVFALFLAGTAPLAGAPAPPTPVCPGLILRAEPHGGLWPLTTTALPLVFAGACPAAAAPFGVDLDFCVEDPGAVVPVTLTLRTDGLEIESLRTAARDGAGKAWEALPSQRTESAGLVQLTALVDSARFRHPNTGEVAFRLELVLRPTDCQGRGSSGLSIRTVTLGPPPGG
jgi:hypothetical protein